MLDKIFSNSNINLNYDFIKFTVNEMKILNYNMIKKLCENSFIQRAERMIKHD